MCPGPRPTAAACRLRQGQNLPEVGLHQCPSERKGEGGPVRSLPVPSHVPATRRMPPKCGAFPLQPRRSPRRQTACWSKGDSNSWSHPERQRSEGASHRPPFNSLDRVRTRLFAGEKRIRTCPVTEDDALPPPRDRARIVARNWVTALEHMIINAPGRGSAG
jgi:hypothetical protein